MLKKNLNGFIHLFIINQYLISETCNWQAHIGFPIYILHCAIILSRSIFKQRFKNENYGSCIAENILYIRGTDTNVKCFIPILFFLFLSLVMKHIQISKYYNTFFFCKMVFWTKQTSQIFLTSLSTIRGNKMTSHKKKLLSRVANLFVINLKKCVEMMKG